MSDPIKMARDALIAVDSTLEAKVLNWNELPSEEGTKVFSGMCDGMVIICIQAKCPDGHLEHMASATLGALIIKLPGPLAVKAWKLAEHDANNKGSTSGESGFSA